MPISFLFIFTSDIGLIKLLSPVKFSDVIQPVNLACTSSNNSDVIAIGTGLTSSYDTDLAPILQHSHMKTLSKNKCFLYLPTVAFRNSIICSIGEKNQSICSGDAGGPLVEIVNHNLVGIASYQSTFFGCDSGAPQAFTRVSVYLPWIKQITGISCRK